MKYTPNTQRKYWKYFSLQFEVSSKEEDIEELESQRDSFPFKE